MKKVIVLVTEGKHEIIDYATVVLFNNEKEAKEFCRINNTGFCKYWKKAEIIEEDERIELSQPTYEKDEVSSELYELDLCDLLKD